MPTKTQAVNATKPLPALDASVTAGMSLTAMKALGRESVFVTARGVVVGIASREHLTGAATNPGGANRPLRDAAERCGLVWL